MIQVGPWETVFWFMAALALVLLTVTVALLPESHPPERRVPLRVGEIVAGLVMVFRVPAFHRMAWAGTLVFGAQFLYIGGAAIFVVDLLGQGELDFWKLFVPMIGAIAGAMPKMTATWLISRCASAPSKRSRMIVRLTIVEPPAASPCTTRPTSNHSSDGAKAHATDATPYAASETTMTGLRPIASDSGPWKTLIAAKASM